MTRSCYTFAIIETSMDPNKLVASSSSHSSEPIETHHEKGGALRTVAPCRCYTSLRIVIFALLLFATNFVQAAESTNAAPAAAQAKPPAGPVDWKNRVADYVQTHGPKLLSAIVILLIGFFVARWAGRIAQAWLGRKELQLEPPVRMLMVRLLRLLVIVFALVIAAGTAGMDVTALVASIGVAGVGVGLATQGVLSNIVAGLTIIFTKPFRVGEYIEMLGTHGQVTAIELFSTTLLHSDRSRVVIPNRKIVGEILHNYGTVRQLDLSVGIGYGMNVNDALATLRAIVSKNPRVFKDPAPVVAVTSLGDSAVNLAIKPWVSVADFGAAAAEINQAILEEFRAKEIAIPFPQREIRLLNPEVLAGGDGLLSGQTNVRSS
jgi:small conductance mechanosensitive channel